MQHKRIGVVGAGTMGSGIAQTFAAHGFSVVLNDVTDEALTRGLNSIHSSLDRLVASDKMSDADKIETLNNIQCTTEMQEMHDVDVAIEVVSENFEIKTQVFQAIDKVCKPSAILASNTSSISLTKIAAQTSRSDKVIGMHFMNPVPVMHLVEVIRALQTSDETWQIIDALCRDINKVAVPANDSPGFVANRILMPMINEAIYCLYEGVGEAADIDEIMKLGMNHPMGPLALADLIGLDVCLSVLRVLQEGLGDPKYRPCPMLIQMVDAGYLGRKSGKGFYNY